MQNKGHYAVQCHSRSPILVAIEKNIRLPISDIWLPILRLTPSMEGFPISYHRKKRYIAKIFRGCQWMAKVPNGVETLPKISID